MANAFRTKFQQIFFKKFVSSVYCSGCWEIFLKNARRFKCLVCSFSYIIINFENNASIKIIR